MADEPDGSEIDVFDTMRAEQRRLSVVLAGGSSDSLASLVDMLCVLSSLDKVDTIDVFVVLLLFRGRPIRLRAVTSVIADADLDSAMEVNRWARMFLASSMFRFMDDRVGMRRGGSSSAVCDVSRTAEEVTALLNSVGVSS